MSNIDKQKLLVEMVMRQTQYTYEEASNELDKHNNNYISVIRGSMGINKQEDKTIRSINQHVYKEIRGLMDTASTSYRRKQEIEKKKEELIEKLREEYIRRQSLEKNKLLSIEEKNENDLEDQVEEKNENDLEDKVEDKVEDPVEDKVEDQVEDNL